nr:MAG TPA: hypothetical protein [Bacteriophage sp.]
MAISYTKSVRQNTQLKVPGINRHTAESTSKVYNSENWTLDSRYRYCPEYQDDNVVIIDRLKGALVQSDKISITQGSNSEFIPFELDRYYDGFDLCNTIIVIHFLNKNGYDDYSSPINVYYNDEKIKFGWLIDSRVTAVEGCVEFEIEATGKNSGGEKYEWRTKPCDCINVLRSISGSGPIRPDSNWVTDLIECVQGTLADVAEIKAQLSTIESLLDDINGEVI